MKRKSTGNTGTLKINRSSFTIQFDFNNTEKYRSIGHFLKTGIYKTGQKIQDTLGALQQYTLSFSLTIFPYSRHWDNYREEGSPEKSLWIILTGWMPFPVTQLDLTTMHS